MARYFLLLAQEKVPKEKYLVLQDETCTYRLPTKFNLECNPTCYEYTYTKTPLVPRTLGMANDRIANVCCYRREHHYLPGSLDQ